MGKLKIDAAGIRFYPTAEQAETIAAANRTGDPDWSYTVVQLARGFAVAIADDDGEFVGYLG